MQAEGKAEALLAKKMRVDDNNSEAGGEEGDANKTGNNNDPKTGWLFTGCVFPRKKSEAFLAKKRSWQDAKDNNNSAEAGGEKGATTKKGIFKFKYDDNGEPIWPGNREKQCVEHGQPSPDLMRLISRNIELNNFYAKQRGGFAHGGFDHCGFQNRGFNQFDDEWPRSGNSFGARRRCNYYGGSYNYSVMKPEVLEPAAEVEPAAVVEPAEVVEPAAVLEPAAVVELAAVLSPSDEKEESWENGPFSVANDSSGFAGFFLYMPFSNGGFGPELSEEAEEQMDG